MGKVLVQSIQNSISNKDIKATFVFKINGIDYSKYVQPNWTVNTDTGFGSMSAIFTLDNNSKIFSNGGTSEIKVGDIVSFIENFGDDTTNWERFYGIIDQRAIDKSSSVRTITLNCLDYISVLRYMDIDLVVEGTRVEVVDEVLDPIWLPSPNQDMAQLYNFANDSIATKPIPIIRFKDLNHTTNVDTQMDGFEIYYETGQLKLGTALNVQNNYEVLSTYSYYVKGKYAEDIIEEIITAADGYGKYLFGESSAANVITNHLTTTYQAQEGSGITNILSASGAVSLTVENTLASDVIAGDVTVTLTDATGFPTSGSGTINGDVFSWTGKSTNTLTGVPATGGYSLSAHNADDYVEYENTYPAGQVWFLKYSNLTSSLTTSDFSLPSGSTVIYHSKRGTSNGSYIILDSAVGVGERITCNTNYSFKTLQCVDPLTEALTQTGWKKYDELQIGDLILTLNTKTGESEWNKIENLNIFNHKGKMIHLKNKSFDALVTSEHKWPVSNDYQAYHSKNDKIKIDLINTVDLKNTHRIINKGVNKAPANSIYSDDFVKLVGWYVTEGSFYKYKYNKVGGWQDLGRIGFITITQSEKCNLKKCLEIEQILKKLNIHFKINHRYNAPEIRDFKITGDIVNKLNKLVPSKKLNFEFISKLTENQRVMLLETLIKGDGSYLNQYGRNRVFYTSDKDNADMFQLLCALMNYKTSVSVSNRKKDRIKGVKIKTSKTGYSIGILNSKYTKINSLKKTIIDYNDIVWCPTVKNKTWLMKRNGRVTFTGNSTGIEINKMIFRSREVDNRFDAINNVRDYLAPNYIIRTQGDKLIWSSYLEQKSVADYDLELVQSLNYQEDEDLYTRVLMWAKNKIPTNIMFGDDVDYTSDEEDSYTGIATKDTLSYFGEEKSGVLSTWASNQLTEAELLHQTSTQELINYVGDKYIGTEYASQESTGYYVFGTVISDNRGKIILGDTIPIVYVNGVPIDNEVHQQTAVPIKVKTTTKTITEGGGKSKSVSTTNYYYYNILFPHTSIVPDQPIYLYDNTGLLQHIIAANDPNVDYANGIWTIPGIERNDVAEVLSTATYYVLYSTDKLQIDYNDVIFKIHRSILPEPESVAVTATFEYWAIAVAIQDINHVVDGRRDTQLQLEFFGEPQTNFHLATIDLGTTYTIQAIDIVGGFFKPDDMRKFDVGFTMSIQSSTDDVTYTAISDKTENVQIRGGEAISLEEADLGTEFEARYLKFSLKEVDKIEYGRGRYVVALTEISIYNNIIIDSEATLIPTSTLTYNVTTGDTKVHLTDTTAFSSSGTAYLDKDSTKSFTYTGKTTTTLTGCTITDSATSGEYIVQSIVGDTTLYDNEGLLASLGDRVTKKMMISDRNLFIQSELDYLAKAYLKEFLKNHSKAQVNLVYCPYLYMGQTIHIVDSYNNVNRNYFIESISDNAGYYGLTVAYYPA